MLKSAAQKPGPSHWRRLWLVLVLAALAWIAVAPRDFVNLWVTPDQQAWLWFQHGDYERAARTFEDPRWKGFSLYADQDFATAERYFSQYQDAESLLARANALAHQRDYAAAKQAYEELASRYPDHPAAAVNLPAIEAIIEATQGMSESKGSEKGDRNSKPGDGSESSKGGEQQGTMELE